jgi:hypothetical protein
MILQVGVKALIQNTEEKLYSYDGLSYLAKKPNILGIFPEDESISKSPDRNFGWRTKSSIMSPLLIVANR